MTRNRASFRATIVTGALLVWPVDHTSAAQAATPTVSVSDETRDYQRDRAVYGDSEVRFCREAYGTRPPCRTLPHKPEHRARSRRPEYSEPSTNYSPTSGDDAYSQSAALAEAQQREDQAKSRARAAEDRSQSLEENLKIEKRELEQTEADREFERQQFQFDEQQRKSREDSIPHDEQTGCREDHLYGVTCPDPH